jgi:hypothetical protein
MVILSVVAFGLGAWWTLIGRISEGDGVFMLFGWCLCGIVFWYRAVDPAYLDAVSIIKSPGVLVVLQPGMTDHAR